MSDSSKAANRRSNLPLVILASLLALGPAACQPRHEPAITAGELPPEVMAAAHRVREAYAFAAANPDLMMEIPCYCGCGAIGHKSNYDCYVASVEGDGRITYDLHALGCSVCVEITQDAMRLLEQGRSGAEIRAFIDARYGRYGPSNMP
ncbi:MAG TPA: PCYCGC motif-containing (lipo)protein [Anaerolineales bacterium]